MCGWLCPRVVEEPWPGCHGANVGDFDVFWGVREPMGSRPFEHLVSTWLSFLGLIAGNMSGQYSLIARPEG